MKKIALIGGTGFVGSHLLTELTNRGFEVTAIARDVQQLKDLKHVLALQADVNDAAAIAGSIKWNDAVISAFNAGWSNPNIYDDYTKGARAILEAVKSSGIKRFIVIGGAGSLTIDGHKLIDSPDFPKDIKPGAQAATDYLEVIKREHDLDWTFFSPAMEMHPGTSGQRTGKYRTGGDSPVFDEQGKSVLSVEDLAVAIVDELENNKFIKQRFTAAY